MSIVSQAAGLTPPAVTKPRLRHPALGRKFDDIEEADTPSPRKRAKVTFDSDVEVRVMEEWEKAPEFIQEEVRRGLERHVMGDNSIYIQVKDVYGRNKSTEDEPSDCTLYNYTAALLSNVSSLNKSFSDLVFAVLNSQWLGREEHYIRLYVRFLANLVSAQGVYLADTLRMLVKNLAIATPSNSRSPSLPSVSRSQVYNRTHKALQYLLQLIPSASCVLSSILTNTFPHETESKRAHAIYIQNMLKVIAYAPQLQNDVLALITERLVKVDVQVQVDLEDLAEDVGDGLLQDIPQINSNFEDDMDDSENSGDESVASDETSNAEVQRTKDITRNVEKMDIILDILFDHYTQMISRMDNDSRLGALDILLSQFITIILPTHRSRHTQFLLFHFAQLSPSLIDTFVGTCVQITFDKVQPSVVRQAAAAYLASFVARGTHVPSDIVCDVFDYIGAELERLRTIHDPICRGPDLKRYSIFYSLVQALLYIFCFRWRDLESTQAEDYDDTLDEFNEHHWKPNVKEILASNIFSKLNPLKICSPIIVTEFARAANHLGVVYVFHLLETNKRIRLSSTPLYSSKSTSTNTYNHPERETALSARRDESHYHLDEYFPFDPYHLPRSKRWLDGDYREWAGIPGLDEEEDSGSEDDDEDENEMDSGDETERSSGSY